MTRNLTTGLQRGLRQSIAGGLGAGDIFSTASLDLNFARHKSLDSRITFSRASSGTYVDADGVIRTAGNNVARFDHNPTTGKSLGLLVEESRTNLLTRSEEFDNTSWGKAQSSVTTGFEAPDGSSSAEKLIANTVSSRHYVAQSQTITAGGTYTISCYAKAGEYNYATVVFGKGGSPYTRGGSTVDLTTGEITDYVSGSPTSLVRHSAQDVGNGWWRISVTVQIDGVSTDGYSEIGVSSTDANYSNFTGDGTSGVYIWGAQLEAGSFPTSYIRTESSTVTRSADVASITGTNFSSWYNQDVSTVFCEYTQGTVAANKYPVLFAFRLDPNSGSANSIEVFMQNNGGFGLIKNGGSNQAADSYSGISTGAQVKTALVSNLNDFKGVTNGSVYLTDTSGTPTSPLYQMVIGQNIATDILSTTISRITYWPTRLSNDTLQTITR